MVIELLLNVALLVALSVALQALGRHFHRSGVRYRAAVGALFGIVGVVAMMTPLQFAPGVIYDGRSIILSLAGFVGGPVTATVAAVICAGYRLYLGGAGATVGVMVILQSAAFGIIFYYLRQRSPRWEQPLHLWLLGLSVHVPMLMLQLFLPNNLWTTVLPAIGPSVLVLYPLAFMITAMAFLDNEHRRALGTLLSIQNRVLTMIAAGAPLSTTLGALVNAIETEAPGIRASILLLDADGRHLRHVAAPSLPPAYVAAIDGLEVRDGAGSCGTAVYQRRQVIVEKIATDPLWADFKELALQHNLHACWSTPIFDDAGQVQGTFAMYYASPKRPETFHLQMIEQATHLASIAITRDRQEQVLRSERDFARQVVDRMGEGLAVTDVEQRLTYVNHAYADMVGYAADALLGKQPFEFAVFDNSAQLEHVVEMRRRGLRSSYEARLRHADGHEVPVLVSGAPYMRDGQLLGTITVITDLTERIRAEDALRESEERYRRLIDTSPYAIGIFQDDKIVFANRSAAELLGAADPADLVGRSLSDVAVLDATTDSTEDILQLLSGEPPIYQAETMAIRSDGAHVPIEVIVAPFRLDGRAAIQVIAQDITERRRRQLELEAQAQITQALSETSELEPLLNRILEAAAHAVEGANKGSIMLPDADHVLQIRALAVRLSRPAGNHRSISARLRLRRALCARTPPAADRRCAH